MIGEAFINEEELIAKVAYNLFHSAPSSHLDSICKNEFANRIVNIIDELVQTYQPELNEDVKEPFFSRKTALNLFSTNENEIALEEPSNPSVASHELPTQQTRSYRQTRLPSQIISQVLNILSRPWRKSKANTEES